MSNSRDQSKAKVSICPGIWIEQDDSWHFDPAPFLIYQGIDPSPENMEMATELMKEIIRKEKPQAILIDL
jgi:hypothetical protein